MPTHRLAPAFPPLLETRMTSLADISTLAESQRPYRAYVDRLCAIIDEQLIPYHGTLYTDELGVEARAELYRAVTPDDPAAFCAAIDTVLPLYVIGADDGIGGEALNALILNTPVAN